MLLRFERWRGKWPNSFDREDSIPFHEHEPFRVARPGVDRTYPRDVPNTDGRAHPLQDLAVECSCPVCGWRCPRPWFPLYPDTYCPRCDKHWTPELRPPNRKAEP